MQNRSHIVALLITIIMMTGVVATGLSGHAVAQEDRIDMEVEDEYDGVSEDGDQTITLSVTVIANDPVIGATIQFDQTGQSFIDPDTFEVTAADPEWENPRSGVYEIEELDSGEEMTFSFEVYPRVLDQDTLDVTSVSITADNPEGYSVSEDVSADLSTSPWLQYQNSLDQINELESESDTPFLFAVFGGGVGLIGLVFAGYFFRSKQSSVEEKNEEALDTLRSLRAEMQSVEDQQTVSDYIDDWKEDSDSGTNSGSGGLEP